MNYKRKYSKIKNLASKFGIVCSAILLLALLTGCGITGNAAKDTECNCQLVERQIAFELGSKSANGKGIMGSSVTVPVKNNARGYKSALMRSVKPIPFSDSFNQKNRNKRIRGIKKALGSPPAILFN